MITQTTIYWFLLHDKGEMVFAVRPNGTIEHGKDFTPERAVKLFEEFWQNGNEKLASPKVLGTKP